LGLLSLLTALIGLALPVFTGLVFSSTIPAGNRLGLTQIAVMLLMLAVTLGVFSYTRGVSMVRLQTRIDNGLQAAVWDRLLTLPPSFFRDFTAGDLAVRVTNINQVSAIVFNSVLTSLLGAVFSLVNLVLIFVYSASLALLALALLVVALAVSLTVASLQLRARRRVFEIQGRLSGVVLQLVSAIAKLRDTGSEERAFMRWSDGFVEMTRATVKAARIGIVSLAFNAAFPVVCSAATFAVFYFFLSDGFQTGPFMAYTTAFGQLLVGLLAMSTALTWLTNAAPLYERTRPILEAVPEVDDTKTDPGALRGHIEMSHVTFSYDPEAPPTIHDLSLEARPGEFVAIVGPSGAGKSTLFRLLLGFDAPDSGEIRYDEQDLRTLDLTALRRQVSTVLQNGRVFSGSIQLNIAGAAQLTQDEIWEAARAAGLEEDIEAMPMGMFTYVAEGGVTLSGGQRQRLLIARALSTRPAILFFDEATSSLDNRTQALVMESLEALNATRVVIAQRLSTVRAADRIYVLEDGRVAQQGTYEELMSRPGLFKRLAERQLV
jgi:ATP-binding cassette subfamily C protein